MADPGAKGVSDADLAGMDTLDGASLSDDPFVNAATQATPAPALRSDALASTLGPGPESDPPAPLEPPELIAHYERIRQLGQGGMGTVYLARDTKLGRRVALKVLRPGRGGRTDRFFREARATAALQHEHIVVIHEVGAQGELPYMVLEYLEGQPLRGLVAGQPLPPRQAVELAVPIVRALVHAHAHGIVHRDLKPENVFVTEAGVVKVLDFGIAKLLEQHSEDGDASGASPARLPEDQLLTSAGALIGTVRYMAPEQFRGQAIDARADLYAVGLMLYEMLAGVHPYERVPREELRATVAGELSLPPLARLVPGVPGDLERLVQRCLASDPDARWSTASELLSALQATVPERYAAHLAAGESPYPGLSAFSERDAGRFFGRSRDVSRVTSLLADQPLVAIVGHSGVGKSSLVRAGVLPALRATEPWERFTLRPGRYPLRALASVLSESRTDEGPDARHARLDEVGERLAREPGHFGAELRRYCATKEARGLIFVDQLEEAFTLAEAEERAAFFASLLGAADDPSSPLRVVVSLRSDFLDRVSESGRMLDAVTRGLILLGPPDREQLEAALVGPAELAGYRFEDPATVDAMLDALEGSPAALPLLQFAAGQLWESRDREGKRFTARAYEEMGGIRGLLAGHADSVLASLPADGRALTRTLFLRLVTAERTRAVVERDELLGLAEGEAGAERVVALLDRLVAARLLVVQTREAGGATYELAHEALIENWPTLQRWLAEGREHAGFVEQLSAAARQWDTKGRPAGLLWRGDAADDAEHFERHYPGPLAPRERDYLDAVLTQKRRATSLRRWSVVAIITVLLAVVAGGSVALVRISAAEEDAVDQADRAEEAAGKLREANTRLQSQFEALQRKERERKAAENKARVANATAEERGEKLVTAEKDLARTNDELREALGRAKEGRARAEEAEAEALRKEEEARAAARREKAAADTERALRIELKAALGREQARVKKLEDRARRIQMDKLK